MPILTPRLAALVAFVGSFALSGLAVWWVETADMFRQREQVQAVARDRVRALGGVVERSLTASYALAALVRQGGGEIADFDAVAGEMLQYYPSVSVLALSPGGVIRQTAPLDENRASLGFDQFADPIQGEEARRARDSGVLTLAGPLELVQGGLGVVGRLPVFLDDPEADAPTFWGLVNVVIPADRVLDEAGLDEFVERGIDYELWRLDPNSGERTVISRQGASPLPNPVSEGVELPNGTWTLSAAPAGGWGPAGTLLRRLSASLLISLLVGWVVHLLVVLRSHQSRLEEEVEERTTEIREARNQLEAMLAAIPDLLFEMDSDGTYLALHAARDELLVASRDALVGSNINDRLPPDVVFEVRSAILEAEAQGWSVGRQYPLDLPVGRRWFEISVSRKPALKAERPTYMVLARDVTARKAADEALRESEARYLQAQKLESIGRLAGGVAHDFNNLLTIIRGAADLVSDAIPRDHEAHEDLAQIRLSAERGAALTQQLLGTSSQQVVRPIPLELNQVVGEFLDLIRRMIGPDIRVVSAFSDTPAWIRSDRNQLSQVFLNLATNARDAMPDGGTLTLEIRTFATGPPSSHDSLPENHDEGSWVCLRISDTGVGIPPDALDRVFEPFFTTKAQGQGTGLGLATVFGIVRQSGGEIQVDSAPGVGTRFDLWFPALDVPESSVSGGTEGVEGPVPLTPPTSAETDSGAGLPLASLSPDGAGTPRNVLLVEDEPAILRMARQALEREGFRVLSAPTGEEALTLLDSAPFFVPDALVTDVVMPGVNGVELATILREGRAASPPWPHIPVLFTSGFADHPVLQGDGLPPGSAFLSKPYAARNLVAKLRELIDSPEESKSDPSPPLD